MVGRNVCQDCGKDVNTAPGHWGRVCPVLREVVETALRRALAFADTRLADPEPIPAACRLLLAGENWRTVASEGPT
jgi:hypothetical protein